MKTEQSKAIQKFRFSTEQHNRLLKCWTRKKGIESKINQFIKTLEEKISVWLMFKENDKKIAKIDLTNELGEILDEFKKIQRLIRTHSIGKEATFSNLDNIVSDVLLEKNIKHQHIVNTLKSFSDNNVPLAKSFYEIIYEASTAIIEATNSVYEDLSKSKNTRIDGLDQWFSDIIIYIYKEIFQKFPSLKNKDKYNISPFRKFIREINLIFKINIGTKTLKQSIDRYKSGSIFIPPSDLSNTFFRL